MMTDEFIQDCVASAASLAEFFVGCPDDQMLIELYQMRADLAAGLEEKFGADIASMIAESFVATVIRHRREIEAGDATPRVLN
jgi:hypothetical protein